MCIRDSLYTVLVCDWLFHVHFLSQLLWTLVCTSQLQLCGPEFNRSSPACCEAMPTTPDIEKIVNSVAVLSRRKASQELRKVVGLQSLSPFCNSKKMGWCVASFRCPVLLDLANFLQLACWEMSLDVGLIVSTCLTAAFLPS